MDVHERLKLIEEVGEEIVTGEDLQKLLEEKKYPVAYDGFEPSGNIHIAQGILRAININKMIQAGFTFKMLVADWHAAANNKFGGDLQKIQIAGKYFIEVWKACGLDDSHIEFVWASDVVKDPKYWELVLNIARMNTVQRIIRCSQIMGRSESESLSAAQILYPCMQCADIFYLKADAPQLGMDQRKVNMLAREVAEKLGYPKPVVVSHHMLMGLGKPPLGENTVEKAMEMKMSKSKPDSAIFMTDSAEDIKRKISKAHCPEKIIEENPIIEYCKYIVFEKFDSLKIERPEKFGGNLTIDSYEMLVDVYTRGDLHPMDLKNAVSHYLNELIKPVREHFEKNKHAHELLQQVKSFDVTR
jgi:tyrosyl-tRNA synthetase